ncbi:hypothetical protein BKA59DRAFT_495900 [Fusarium tricinctum]|uniref:Uncharacterized protein n=1 Tax=Fusarium tricinctum TaxID=61284 RepID=A0A8K0WAH5_9HYPO|nr:hypothetical protein BKA59DRAFT_495900 [Fusarium tricinctum]
MPLPEIVSPAFHKAGSRRHHLSRQNKILSIRFRGAKATKRHTAAGMGYHGNPVAVLDMKSDQVRPLDKADVEGMLTSLPQLPANKSTGKDYFAEFIAEVNLWSMGVRYNLHRLLGNGPQLYVMNA